VASHTGGGSGTGIVPARGVVVAVRHATAPAMVRIAPAPRPARSGYPPPPQDSFGKEQMKLQKSRHPLFLLAALAAVLVACAACAADKKDAAAAMPTGVPANATEDQKTLYNLGLALSQNLAPFSLTEADLPAIVAGLGDGVRGKGKFDPEKDGPKIQALAQARSKAAGEVEAKAGLAYVEKAAKEPGAKKTESGLVYKEEKAGTGASPKATDTVRVHYHGTLIDGTVFDSSVQKGQPLDYPVNKFVPCWMEALQMMKVGGKAKVICPSSLAYGDHGSPPLIKPGATLVFDMELIDILKDAPPPAN
jgi:FKBP-type peptidyl-prolyl cis-trans isomerase FkpA